MRKHAAPGSQVLDVGANIGVFTVLFAKWVGDCGHVVAVEPGARTVEYLQHNVSRNDVGDRVTIRPSALGASEGDTFLRVDPKGEELGASRISDSGQPVRMQTLDNLWSELGCPRFDLIKIDVEGHESQVLEGARKMFGKKPPKVCVVEFNQYFCQGKNARWMWDFFMQHGYAAYDVYDRQLQEAPEQDADVVFRRVV